MQHIALRLYEAIHEDDSRTMRQDVRARALYETAPSETKQVIDALFIAICGFSFCTLAADLTEEEEE